jgi:hypothetical protein
VTAEDGCTYRRNCSHRAAYQRKQEIEIVDHEIQPRYLWNGL